MKGRKKGKLNLYMHLKCLFLGTRMFYIEIVFNWMWLYYEDWIKENVQLSITELKLDLRMFCKG